MKKRILFSAVSCLIGIFLLISVCACGGGNASKEFAEFEAMMLNIMEDAKGGAEGSSAALCSSYSAERGYAETSADGEIFAERDRVFDELGGSDEKEVYDTRSYYADAVEQTVMVPLFCAYGLVNIHGAKSLYDNNLYFESWAQSVRIENDGDKTYFYVYTDNTVYSRADTYLYAIVDYRSESEYEFVYHQFTGDLEERLLVYGSSEGVFLMASASADEKVETGGNIGHSESNNFIFYKDGGEEYYVYGESTLNNVNGTLASRFSAIDQGKIESVRDNIGYALSEAELYEINEYYYGNNGAPVEEEGEWLVDSEGVLMGYSGSTTPEELIAPDNATSIYYNFFLPGGVKKLTLHSGIKSVVIDKTSLEQKLAWEKDEEIDAPDADSGEFEFEWVECPERFAEFDVRDGTLEEIVTEDGCVLQTRDGCLYYNDTLMCVPSDDSITELVIDAEKCSYGLRYGSYPLLKGLKKLEFIGSDNSGNSNPMPYEAFKNMLRRNSGSDAFELESFTVRGLFGNYNNFRLGDNGDEDMMEIRSAEKVAFYGDNASVSVSYPRRKVFSIITFGDGIISYELAEDEAFKEDDNAFLGNISVILSDSVKDGDLTLMTDEYVPHFAYIFDLPWTKTEFKSLEKYRAVGKNECPELDYSTNTHELFEGVTLEFALMSDEEIKDALNKQNFSTGIYTDEQGSYVRIYSYNGSSSVIKVPEFIDGLPVKDVWLDGYSVDIDITEISLPAGLKDFSLNDFEEKIIGRIVFGGTKSEFVALMSDGKDMYSVFAQTERIVCSDGEIVSQPAIDKITFTESGGSRLIVNVDWSGGTYYEIISAEYITTDEQTVRLTVSSAGNDVRDMNGSFTVSEEEYVKEKNVILRVSRLIDAESGYWSLQFNYAYIASDIGTEINLVFVESV